MHNVRGSSMPWRSACGPSGVAPEIVVDSDGPDRRLGSAFHECAAQMIVHDIADVPAVAAKWDVPKEELRPLVSWAAGIWQSQLAGHFPDRLVEEDFAFVDEARQVTVVSAHLDVHAVVGDEVRIGDWKPRRGGTDPRPQLKCYGYAALRRYTDAKRVRATALYYRDQEHETWEWTRDELNGWYDLLCERLGETEYRPGPHCGYCPRALECKAHLRQFAVVRALVTVANRTDGCAAGLAAIEPQYAGDMVSDLRAYAKLIEQTLAAVKAHVQAHGGTYGPLELTEKPREKIDVAAGWDALCSVFGVVGMEPILRCLSLSKDGLYEASGAIAPPRGKGKLMAEVMDKLRAAGAIQTTYVQQLTVRRDYGDSDTTRAIPATAGGADPEC